MENRLNIKNKMDFEQIETRRAPACLLCSSQDNYCFNSPADVFGLIRINQRKKGVSRWLANLAFLDRSKLQRNSEIFLCEVHYAKDDLIRERRNDRACVKLINEQVVPCYVKLEDRALNNRINSFLSLVEDFENCLNLEDGWIAKVLKDKFILMLDPKGVQIKIEDNLMVSLWENEAVLEIKFAIDTGYIECNKRIMFWSRLRGLMKYFEEKTWFSEAADDIVPQALPKGTVALTPKVKEREKILNTANESLKKDVLEIQKIKTDSEIILTNTTGDENQPTPTKLKIKLSTVEIEPLAFKIYKLTPKQEKLIDPEPNVNCLLKTKPPEMKPHFLTKTEQAPDILHPVKIGGKDDHANLLNYDPDTIKHFTELVMTLTHNRLPNWLNVAGTHGVCALEITVTPFHKPYILKALKVNKNLYISAYINGQNVVNNLINQTPGQLSKKELLSFINTIDRIPIKFSQNESLLETEIKQEKLHFDDLTYDTISTFDVLVTNLSAFAGNEWYPVCIKEKFALIFKVDISGQPKFKRYICINRNLELTVFNKDRIIEIKELIKGDLHPLTFKKIHKILALLDETVFEQILRPSKYRLKHLEEGTTSVKSGNDYRVAEGTTKKHKCTVCAYESNIMNYVKQHYEIKHTPPDRKCPECGKEMNATQLKIHARFHIKKVSHS